MSAKTPSSRVRLVALNFRVPVDVRRKLRILAAQRDVTMTELIIGFLDASTNRTDKLLEAFFDVKIS